MKHKGLRMNTVLLLALIGTVLLVLLSAMLLFLRTYQRSLIRNAATNSQRTISQVGNTVNDYLADIDKVMEILNESLEDRETEREDFFGVFLRIRPGVVAVSTYDADGTLAHCYSLLGNVRPTHEENTSFDAANTAEYEEGYISPPHVVSLFEGAYPWVITMISTSSTRSSAESP